MTKTDKCSPVGLDSGVPLVTLIIGGAFLLPGIAFLLPEGFRLKTPAGELEKTRAEELPNKAAEESELYEDSE